MRSTFIAWLVFVAGCTALALDGPDSEEARPDPDHGKALPSSAGDARCPPGSTVALDEAFADDAAAWPGEWEISGEGDAFVEDGAAQLAADPGKRVRATLRRWIDWTEVSVEVRFSDSEPQALSLVDHGPEAEGFALTGYRSFDPQSHAPATQWLFGAGPADRRIGSDDDGPYARSQWIRLRARTTSQGRGVQWRRSREGDDPSLEWTDLTLSAPPAGQLALVFDQGRDAEQSDALRIERVVVCERKR